MAAVNVVRIPYASDSQEKADLIGGQVQLTFGGAASVAPYVKSGRLRALAVTSVQPSALLPALPTMAASGLPGYEAVSLQGVFTAAKTPVAIVNRLNQEIVRVLNQPDVKEKFLNTGIEPVGSSPEQFAVTLKSEVARWSKVIKDAGIRIE
jgi:tripartite-type tricarboxylate transporter receptor subunit TctC